ncbi:MAG: lamin tail domain-containing protein [Sandaracinus sp.]
MRSLSLFALLSLLLALSGCPSQPAAPGFDGGGTGVDGGSGLDTGIGHDGGSGNDAGGDDAGGGGDAGGGDDAGGGMDAASGADAGANDASVLFDAGGTDAATGSDAGTPTLDHLVFTEVAVTPNAAEMIEIWNPTAGAISLSGYYLSDNATYPGIAAGTAFSPPLATAGSDFLVTFPADASIGPDDVIVIATDMGFAAQTGVCPDYILAAADVACPGGGTSRAMAVPTNGARGSSAGLTNGREMLVLFRWNGTEATLHDVDYVTWGDTFDAETRADKTSLSGYAADTPPASQHPAPVPTAGQSIERCALEVGETRTGGNGISGHDETSERLDMAFRVVTTPTPGVHASCL